MGLYLAVPGADYSASPAKLGTQSFLTEDPLPFFALPGLVNWWRGTDAAQVASITSVKDRVAGAVLAASNSGNSPALSTIGGNQGMVFAGAQTLGGANTIPKLGPYSWIFVQKSPASLVTAAYLFAPRAAGGAVPNWYQFSDGHVGAQNLAGRTPQQPSSDAAKVLANATQIIGFSFDPTGLKYSFSFDGVLNKVVPVTAGQSAGAELAPDTFNIGAGPALQNPMTTTFFDIFQFDRDIHAVSNAPYLAWLMAKLKARYAIS